MARFDRAHGLRAVFVCFWDCRHKATKGGQGAGGLLYMGTGRTAGTALERTERPVERRRYRGRYVGMGQRKKPLWPMLRHQYIYYQKFQLGKSFKVVGYFLPKAILRDTVIFARLNFV